MSKKTDLEEEKPAVTGIGGIFFTCEDPAATRAWYAEKLGIKSDQYGGLFEFRKVKDPSLSGFISWSPFPKDTTYFAPSSQPFMINYRVRHLEALLEQLRAEGVEVVGEIQEYEYGKFAHILDPEGNKIELWEPVDVVFSEAYDGKANRM